MSTAHDPLRALLDLLDRFDGAGTAEIADVAVARRAVRAGRPWDRASGCHFTASALVVHPPTGRILLRWHERQRAWIQVGGHADDGEYDPLAIAQREGLEETGLHDLHPWPDRTLRHVAVVPVPANAHESAHTHVDLRFFLATDEPERATPESPAAPLRWVTPEEGLVLCGEENVRETIRRAAAVLGAC